jgi:hypothetical protein
MIGGWKSRASRVVAVAVVFVAASCKPWRAETTDASCHNLFRNKSVSVIAPKQRIDVAIPDEEWPALTSVLREFARARDWSFRDTSREVPDELRSLQLSLCSESSVNVIVAEHHWLQTHAHDRPGLGVAVLMYGDAPREVWQPVARDLFLDLEQKWPDRVGFRTDEGTVTKERPAYLK